jgi:predicted aspartyl protease
VTGEIDRNGTPILRLNLGGREWVAVVDTGFNGDLELPDSLASLFPRVPSGSRYSVLAGGALVLDNMFVIQQFPFDGAVLPVQVSYAPVQEILIGTGLIKDYRLEIDFPAKTMTLTRLRGP